MVNLLAVSLVVVSSIIGAFGGFIFKLASEKLRLNVFSILKNYKLILGFVLFGLSSAIYISALKMEALNILYPISSLTYIWSSIIAWKFLDEKLNMYKWTGIILIILGAILIVG